MNGEMGNNNGNPQQNARVGHNSEAGHRARHCSADQLQHYAGGLLTGLEEERVELHLAACDTCLQLFMIAIELQEESDNASLTSSSKHEPIADGKHRKQLPDMRQLEEQVIAQLMGEKQRSSPPAAIPPSIRRRRTWLQHPVTHYTIAASITIMLLGSGVLASFSEKLQQYDQIPYTATPEWSESAAESWSEKMINRTSSWLDGLQAARFKK